MAKLEQDRDTQRRDGDLFGFEAAERIYTGALVALDDAGNAVAATAAGGRVVGVADEGANAGETVIARRGCFAFDNDEAAPLSLADAGSQVVVADDHTVGKGESGAVAGIMLGLDDFGVWVKI